MKVIFAALFVGWMGSLMALGQEKTVKDPFVAEAADEAPQNIRVQLECIDVSQKDLTRLMMEDQSTTTDAKALRMKVQELVDKGEAKFIDTQMVISRSGQKSTTESIKETIYPIEYNRQNVDLAVESKDSKAIPVGLGGPVAFETRNAGSTFEVEPSTGVNDNIIDVRILAQQVWYTGDTIWHEAKDQLGNVNRESMPNFYKVCIDTSMTVISGQYLLAGVLSPKDTKGHVDPERKVMAFLKCDSLSVVP